MGNLKKVNKILGITLIVFSLGVFANYSKTSSKYFVDDLDNKSDNIVNLISFKSLKYGETKGLVTYSEKLTNLEISDIEYSIKFYRKIVNSNDEDVITDNYRVVVDNGCTITEVVTPKAPTYVPNQDGSINENSKGAMYTISAGDGSSTDNVANLTYVNDVKSNTSEGSSSNDLITVRYTCPLSVVKRNKVGGGEETSTEFNIYEKINDESEFLYLNYTYTKDFIQKVYNVLINGDRLEKMHIPTDDSMINFDEEFDKWVTAFGAEFSKNNTKYPTITAKIRSFISAKDVKNKVNQGFGLKSGASDAGANYKLMYQFDTIASQAETYSNYVSGGNTTEFPNLYFIDPMTSDEATALFRKYLKEYYTYTDAEIEKIITYVGEYGGISSVLGDSTKNIPGITHVLAGPRDYIRVTSSILAQIDIKNRVVVSKNAKNIMQTFKDNFVTLNQTQNWVQSSHITNLFIDISASLNLEESLRTTNSNLNDYYFFRSEFYNYILAFRVYNYDFDTENTYVEVYRFVMNASNPSAETLEINDPTRLMFFGYMTGTTIDSFKAYIDYTSTVIALKTGVNPSDYANVVADGKTWLTTDPHEDNSSVVDFSQGTLFRIEYVSNPKLIPITRTTATASSEQNADDTTTTTVATP